MDTTVTSTTSAFRNFVKAWWLRPRQIFAWKQPCPQICSTERLASCQWKMVLAQAYLLSREANFHQRQKMQPWVTQCNKVFFMAQYRSSKLSGLWTVSKQSATHSITFRYQSPWANQAQSPALQCSSLKTSQRRLTMSGSTHRSWWKLIRGTAYSPLILTKKKQSWSLMRAYLKLIIQI